MRPDQLLRLLAQETGEGLFALDLQCAASWTARGAAPEPKPADQIAVVPLQGVLTPRGINLFGMQLTPGLNTFRAKLEEATAKPEVGAIIVATDSPGGLVRGTPEAAAAVAKAAAVKPVVAFVDGVNASAAYWITSQASQIWMSPSSEAGSLGVMATHIDFSGAMEREGVKATIIRSKSAPFKNETSSLNPLSEEALANLQGEADEQEDLLFDTVAKGRKVDVAAARESFGQGRMMSAQRALDAGMIDKVGSAAELIQSLRTKSGTVRRRFSALAFD